MISGRFCPYVLCSIPVKGLPSNAASLLNPFDKNKQETSPIGFPSPKDEEDHPGLDFHSPEGQKQPQTLKKQVYVKNVFPKKSICRRKIFENRFFGGYSGVDLGVFKPPGVKNRFFQKEF